MWPLAGKIIFFVGLVSILGTAIFRDELKSVVDARQAHIIRVQTDSLRAAKAEITALRVILRHRDRVIDYLEAQHEAAKVRAFASR